MILYYSNENYNFITIDANISRLTSNCCIFLIFPILRRRLPLVQGGTISFLVPTLAILSLPQWKCPEPEVLNQMSPENRTELWQIRMRELSGAIAVSALFQVVIGFGGIVIINHRQNILWLLNLLSLMEFSE